MTAAATQTNQQSAAVAAASEQTSANVQTVATATEELAASIQEIGRQVAHSTKIASKTVEDAKRADLTHTDAGDRRAEDRRGRQADPGHRQPDGQEEEWFGITVGAVGFFLPYALLAVLWFMALRLTRPLRPTSQN
jgi:hypothetical protein